MLPTLIFLLFFACASPRGVQLINLDTKELPSETELILTTTKPVQYKDAKLDNPPCLIISFPEEKIFSSEEGELAINKGPIKKIRTEYYRKEGKGQRQLNLVIVEFTQETPYRISNSGSSIIIKLENPKQPPAIPEKEKNKMEPQPQIQEESPGIGPGYLIGPEDVLKIEVWKQPDISGEIIVNYRGEIRIPPLSKINVIGMTAYQLEEKLTEALSKYIIDPIVFVSVKEYNSQRAIALGETTSGMYTLRRRTTLVEFLSQIGGTTINADTFHIKLIKKDGNVFIYDINELINNPQKSDEIVVSGGDTVYVPPLEVNKVYVLGEVKNPKVINIKGRLTLIDAITEAGGYTADAVTRSVLIVRGELGSQKGIRVNLSQILKKADIGQNIELKPGDIVYVPRTFIADIERFLKDILPPINVYFWYIK